MVPKVVIVGRPNVGKSSLLNMLAGRKVSIVDPTPGVTRDRIATIARLPGPLAGAPPEDEEVTPDALASDDDELENELEDEEAPDAEWEQEDDQEDTEETGPKALDAARAGGLGVSDDEDGGADNDDGDDDDGDFSSGDKFLEVIDTGGYGIQDTQNLTADVERQITVGLTEADLILFVVDAQTGIVPLDQEVARLLRQRSGKNHGKPIVLVANKVDGPSFEAGAAEAARLGLGQPVLLSAKNGLYKRALYDAIRQKIDWSRFPDADREPDLGIKLAIVGKRNVGKSTLVNALAGEDRVIVSELEGTTRDSVDVRFTVGDQLFTAIDTAGLRRGRSVQGKDIEYYSQHRALRSVRRSDVAIFLIDATVPISHVDSQLSAEILRLHKPTVLVVNKWDLAQGKATQEEYGEYLTKELRGLDFAPIVFTSALRVEGVREVVSLAYNLYQQAGHRVPTAELNAVLEAILAERPPTSGIGRQAKIRYLTQTDVHPPTITMFVNDPTMFDAGYQRYLLGQLREKLPYAEVPIKLVIRGRRQGETQENEPRQ